MYYCALPQLKLIDILLQMAEAIRYLHNELYMVHRELHWENWMLCDDG